uniref:Uncharacterized protein n=1 Tax=Esox lucius TaxID=8010 RepID=A0AAY5KBV9_ESOLU
AKDPGPHIPEAPSTRCREGHSQIRDSGIEEILEVLLPPPILQTPDFTLSYISLGTYVSTVRLGICLCLYQSAFLCFCPFTD